jgi:inosine-uridine nucleoside N-ribohydrolase
LNERWFVLFESTKDRYDRMEKLDVPRTLWIDTDIALGANHGDVDDGWAVATLILAVARSEGKLNIAGISVCDGNTDAATAFDCATLLCRNIKDRHDGLIIARSDAAKYIAAVADGSIIVALGPLTNIAAAMTLDTTLAKRTSICTVGGVLKWASFRRRMSDLNMRRDPPAAARVLNEFGRQRRYPLDVIDQLKLDATRLRRIGALSELGAYLAAHSQRWLKNARWRHGRAAFPVWDLVAALGAIDQLPGATYDAQNRLTDFDVVRTWALVESLLAA